MPIAHQINLFLTGFTESRAAGTIRPDNCVIKKKERIQYNQIKNLFSGSPSTMGALKMEVVNLRRFHLIEANVKSLMNFRNV